jgi:hypothetical protein
MIKVSQKAYDALLKSIERWKDIQKKLLTIYGKCDCDESGDFHGPHQCELCKLYHALSCVGCPIYLKTTCEHCVKTPYNIYYDMVGGIVNGKYLDAHQAMIDFMVELKDECCVEEEVFYHVGQHFILNNSDDMFNGSEYVLCVSVGGSSRSSRVWLYNIVAGGNRTDSVYVVDKYKITSKEFNEICGMHSKCFILK